MPTDIFDSCVRTAGDLAGVFEHDGETAYFYLYDENAADDEKVLDSIRVLVGEPDFGESDVSIRWDRTEQKVGLFLRHDLWAVFDTKLRAKFGGGYKPGGKPSLPDDAARGF